MKTIGIFLFLFSASIFFSFIAKAQSNGDYRSNTASGFWAVAGNWEKYNGGWGAAPDYPGQNAGAGTVTIRNGHTITIAASVTNAIGALVVGEGASGILNTNTTANRTITVTNDLTINAGGNYDLTRSTLSVGGNTTINGSMTDTHASGSSVFTGEFHIANGGSFAPTTTSPFTFTDAFIVENGGSFSTSAASSYIFKNGIINDGTFNKTGTGAVTFNANSQDIDGSQPIVMNGVVTVTGVTVNNMSTDLSLTSTSSGALTGTGTWIQQVGSVLKFSGNTITSITVDFSTNANTVNYNRGGTQTVFSTTYDNLTISTSGTKTLGGNVTVNSDLTINSGPTLDPSTLNLTVNGNTVISGTLGDGAVSGTTSLQDVDLSGGTINGAATGVVNINGSLTMPTGNGTIGRMTLTVTGATTVDSSRSLTLNSNTGVKRFDSAITISGSGTWTSTTVSTASNLDIRSEIEVTSSSGSFSAGAATFSTSSQSITGAGTVSFSSGVTISGAITVTNQITNASGITIVGTLDGNNASSTYVNDLNTVTNYQSATQPMNTLGILDVSSSGNYFYYSRGTAQNVRGTTYYNLGISGGASAIKTLVGATTVNGTLTIAASTSLNCSSLDLTVEGQTSIDGSLTDGSSTGTNRFKGLVDINTGGTLSTNNTSAYVFEGGIMNDGTFSKTGAGTVAFNVNNQDIDGTAAITMAGAVTIAAGKTVTYKNSSASGITLSGVLDGGDGSSTWKSDVNAIVYYQPGATTQPMNTNGVLDVSANGNYFYYSRAGAQNVKAATYYNLGISGGGASTKTLQGVTNVNGTLTIAASTSLNPSSFDLTVVGTSTIAGTFADANATGTSSLASIDLSGGSISGGATGIVNASGTLTMPTGDATIGQVALTISGSTTVASGRTLTINSNTGVKTFGTITISGTGIWTSTTLSTTANLVVKGGIDVTSSSGSFSAGGATFNTQDQPITGAGPISFANNVSISGAFVITNTNTNGVTFNGTVDGTTSGSTWKNGASGVTYYKPGVATQPMNTANTVLDVSASGNYFYYSSTTSAQNVKVPASSYYHLYITGGGSFTKTLQGTTSVGGNLYIAASTALDISSYSFSVTGTTTVDGTFTDANNSGSNTFTGLVTVSNGATYTGSGNSATVFEAGITNHGTFNKSGTGAVSFNTNDQNLDGTATMTLSGDVTIASGKTVTYKNTSAGGIALSGALTGGNSSSKWKNDVNTVVYYSNAATPMSIGILDVSASGNSFYYSMSGDQTIKAPATSYRNLILSGSGTKSLTNTTAVSGNLTISSVTLDVVSGQNYSLNVSGNWVSSSGTFLARGGTVTFDGSADQQITSNGSSFNNLVIDLNSPATQVSLNDNLTISTLLTLTEGVITTTSSYLVIISSNASTAVGGYTSASFVNGNLRRNITNNTDTYVFPVGNGTSTSNYYRADLVNNSLNGITYIDAKFKPLTGHNDSEMNVSDDWGSGSLTYSTINTAGVWELTPDANPPASGSYSVKLYIANMSGFTDNNFGPLKRPNGSTSGADWSTGGGTLNSHNTAGRTVASGYMQRSGLTSFSEFGGGGGSGSGAGLPIELLGFSANTVPGGVKIEWTTETETNNDFFTVERSADGEIFRELGVYEAAGNSSSLHKYSIFDPHPLPGISYYRLKQTDIGGDYTYSDVTSVEIKPEELSFDISPNPVSGTSLTVSIPPGIYTLQVNDLSGRRIISESIEISGSGISQLQLPYFINSGLYLISFSNDNRLYRKKIAVKD